jgi:D-glycero-D-manno-heptose 1,7-bisphosphate phosphatase
MSTKSAAFITRDCLIDPLMAPTDEEEAMKLPFVEGAPESLKALEKDGFELIILVNVPAIARNAITPGRTAAIHSRLIARLQDEHGVRICCFGHCPHDPAALCDCRLPATGMLTRLAKRNKIDLATSIYITHDRDLYLLRPPGIVPDRYLLPETKPWSGWDNEGHPRPRVDVDADRS